MAAQDFDPDLYTKMVTLTSKYHRDVYPAIEATYSSAAGKHILITGASRGIGRAIALSWAKAGAAGIAICSRKAESLESVTSEIKAANASTDVLALACDTTKSVDVASLFEAAKAQFGKLDVVVANVGGANQGSTFPKIGDMDEEAWWDDIATNVRSAHLTAHHYIRTFGPDLSGTFITLASSVAAIIIPGGSSYGISKASVIRLVEYLDAEYPNLKAFSLDPGIVKDIATMEAFIPFAYDTPELVGAMSIWLASEKAEKAKGGYVHVTWDVEELEKYGDDIKEKALLKRGALGK
ncbi:hypothetical protein BKA66DRAFT_517181 [Pyrenochaeta sp. MPI-SDFR-AT-0127]|nr:hypothetical protein BKA66DRAFT_517181 [Pyrenochaeta sp. MPI-SDFR-AT-0127]